MADIRNLTVLPRPRTAWQAMDAGFLLARTHYKQLVFLWLGFSLPVFMVCALLQLWLGWSVMMLLWWWFKPLYELPMHLYLSRALFSERLSLIAAWKMALSDSGKLFKTYLTISRFSTARALTYGIVFLERLPRKQRAARIRTMTTVPTRHYLLMLVCFHIEFVLSYAIVTAVAAVFFSGFLIEFEWATTLNMLESPSLQPWIVATSFTAFIAAALVAPYYVTGGFLIYINRRMQVEAWDIEHRFRNIKPKNTAGILTAALLALCLSTSDPSIAQDRANSIASPAAASTTLENILAADDFGYSKKQWIPKFTFNEDNSDDRDSEFSLFELLFGDVGSAIAVAVKALLWAAIAVFIVLLIYTVIRFRRPKPAADALSRTGRDADDAKSHPLTQNLPIDVVATAEQLLKQGERRQALSVLFRGALRAVMNEYDLKVSRGATESDCQQCVSSVGNKQQADTFTHLLSIWQKEAYANEPQKEQTISSLINDWKQAFGVKPNAVHNPIGKS